MDILNRQLDFKYTPLDIHLDLSKAFDTINHNILLKKLEFYGIAGIALNLLQNRKQYVLYDSISSDLDNIKHGVPQGSILGPLLFLIYINDLPNSSTVFNFLMYADVTTFISL